jgi:hypothetical protein
LEARIDCPLLFDKNSKELFFLHIGTKVEILRSNDDWYEIGLPGDKKGWIKINSVVKI